MERFLRLAFVAFEKRLRRSGMRDAGDLGPEVAGCVLQNLEEKVALARAARMQVSHS